MRTGGRITLLNSKIKSLKELKTEIKKLQRQGKKAVFTNGCFDIIHYGHAQYLEDARLKGDALIVAINSDASVRKIKGPCRPVVNQRDRMRTIAALESVDFVTIFDQETPLKLIETLKPDVLVKGADWDKSKIVGADAVLKNGGKVYRIKLAPGRSTTNLIKKIAKTA